MNVRDSTSTTAVVLVVDDNPQFRQLVADFLVFAGYRIIPAGDGIEALEILRSADQTPDLIIADVIMENMNGCEFLRVVREQWGAIPFIMMSTSAKFELSCPELTFRPDAYITKPFSYEELVLLIKAVLLGGSAV